MVAEKVTRRFTPAEYLAIERRAETKSEYIDGCIVAMSGGSKEHARIAVEVLIALHTQLGDGPCELFNSDIRVGNAVTGRYTYPDLSVVCGEAEFEDDRADILLNPTLIVEVLSPSTEAYDRGDKFADYRRLPSLKEYVLIAQDRVSVEHYLRQGEHWLLTAVTDLNASVSLPTIGCVLRLHDVYRRVDLPAEPSA
ncbi:MAG: Uma2 family endonuclease [Dehalococcoidia bacterium]